MSAMQFLESVLSDIVAALVVIILVAGVSFITFGGLKRNWRTVKFARRMRKAGVLNFFCNRQEYGTLRQGRSLSDYLLLAHREFIYVGFYLAGATDRARVDDALKALLRKGCRVELVLLDSDLQDELLHGTEDFLAIARGTLRGLLQHAISHFQQFAATLSADDRRRFIVRRHRAMLSSSAFLVDYDDPGGRVLVDTKIHGAGRDFAYAMEFTRAAAAPSLATEYANSFKRIAVASEVVAFP
jgi:hypothetical protein